MIFPIVLGFPAVIFSIPPLVIRVPAAFSLGIQIPPAGIGCGAVVAVVVDRFVQSDFCLFDGMLALFFFIGVHERCCHKQQKRPRHYGCYG
jgi:hypothetical protein